MMNPVLKGDYNAEKLKQTALGAIFGGGGSTVGAGVSRMIAPRAAADRQIQLLLDSGVTPTPGQLMGGVAGRIEEKLASLPILGDAIGTARRRAVGELNTAAINRALAPIGRTSTAAPGREAVAEAGDALSDAYQQLLPRLTFRADNQFAADLQRLQQMAKSLSPKEAERFEQILRDQVVGKLTPQGVALGETIKGVESELGNAARGYGRSASYDERQLGKAIGEIQSSIRQALSRSNPADAAELARINEGYANFARVRGAAGSAAAGNGVFTPAQLSGAVRAADKSVGKGNFAKGRALMQDLSDAGREVLMGKVPDSGTAGRVAMGAGALGAGFLTPKIPLGLMAASVPYLPGANRAVAATLARRPAGAMALGNELERYLPAIGAIFGATGAPR
jgi:hypothetical protein